MCDSSGTRFEDIGIAPNFFVEWYHENRRSFPWREEATPFQILVTEMLLRQTRASQVERLWSDFMDRFGTPDDLASADREVLFGRVEELGFGNQRVEALTSAARFLLNHHGGQVPDSKDDLLGIPHIGPYAAHAVLCFAHERRVPVVDTNVLRLFCRLLAREVNRLDIRREPWAWKFARDLLPEDRDKTEAHNYGLLDFTGVICKPRSPRCGDCPLSQACAYGQRVAKEEPVTGLP
jgi:A/G-specific adenine glycosylase